MGADRDSELDPNTTRRRIVGAGGTALAALLSGCKGLFSSDEPTPPGETPTRTILTNETSTPTETATESPTETATETESGTPIEEQVVSVGEGSYRTTLPAYSEQPTETTYLADGVEPPIPTNGWWTTLAWEQLGRTLWSNPLVTSPGSLGLQIGAPQEWTTGSGPAGPNYAKLPASYGLTLVDSGSNSYRETRVTGWSDWAVSYVVDGGSGSFELTQVRGSPYLYGTFENGAGLVGNGPIEVWAEDGARLGVTVDGIPYGLYAPSGTTWSVGDGDLSNDLGDGGYLTVAALPEQSSEALATFGEYAHNHVTNTAVEWSYELEAGQVRTTYAIETESMEGDATGTIMGLYPHQHKYTDAETLGYTYVSPRGTMETLAGTGFETTQQYPGMLPFLPDEGDYDRDRMRSYVDEEAEQPSFRPGPEDPSDGAYWTGKNYIRLVEALPVAQQLGKTDAAEGFVEALEGELEGWFTATEDGTLDASDVFYYNDTWGTLQAYPAGFGSPAGLNDHHFHYGYFIRAAAEVARNDPEWAAQDRWGGMVEEVIRDYANPDRDHDRYPFLRTFEPYAGHSWAGGNNGGFAEGNNQESSSEAINAYAAMILWGAYTGNDELREAGVFLYTQETTAAREYWFDEDDENLPDLEAWPYDYACQVWGSGVCWTTWWTDEVEAIYLINVLPVGGQSLYLGLDDEAADATFEEMVEYDSANYNYYPGIEAKYRSLSNPDEALSVWQDMRDSASYAPGLGETRAHTAHWIHNLAAMGTPTPEVTADHPLASVFERDGSRTYVAYNPGDSETTVSFSDGTTLSVPAGEIATK